MMNVEDRVRDALREQAETFTASPDGWQATKALAGHRRLPAAAVPVKRRRGARFAPLAAAAAVAVIGAGAALAGTGALGAALRATGLTPRQAPASAPDAIRRATACRFPQTPKQVPVTGVPISAKVTVDGYTTWWVWGAQGPLGQAERSGLVLCQLLPDRTGSSSSSTKPLLKHGQLVQAGDDPFTGTANGVGVTSIQSVEADLPDGRTVPGYVANGRGFPYAVWWVDYPKKTSVTLVFRDAAGHVMARESEPYTPLPNPFLHPVLLSPSFAIANGCDTSVAVERPSDWVRVQQVMHGIKVWTYVQFVYPRSSAQDPALCEVAGVQGDATIYQSSYRLRPGQSASVVNQLTQTSSVSGISLPGVASVTAEAGGHSYAGKIVNGGGFPYRVWLVAYPYAKNAATLIFRDAAGRQVTVLNLAKGGWPAQ